MTHKLQELAWVAAGQALTLIIGFLSIRMLTNMMGASAYGQLMLGVSIAALLSLFIYGPLGQATIRFYSVCRKRRDLDGYVIAFRNIHIHLLRLLLLLLLAIALLLYLFIGGSWPALAAAALIYSTITGMNHGFLSMFAGMRKRVVVAMHEVGESAARLFGAIGAMYFYGISPGIALVGYAFGSLLLLAFLFRAANRSGILAYGRMRHASGGVRKEMYEEIWQYVRPFLIWSIIGYAFMHGDRWILQEVSGPAAVGIYVAIYQIGSAIPNAVVSVTCRYIEPLVFEQFEASSGYRYTKEGMILVQRAALYFGLMLFILVPAAAIWSVDIIDFVASPDFSHHSSLLAWVMSGTGLAGLGQILTVQGLAMRQPSVYIISKSIAATTLIAAAYFGASVRGVEGVAMALVVAGFVYVASVLAVNMRIRPYAYSQ